MKAQSAVEYLMTYGWMLLVVAVTGSAVFAVAQNSGGESISGFTGADVLVDDVGVTGGGDFQLDLSGGSGQGSIVRAVNVTDESTGEYVYKEFSRGNEVSVGESLILNLPNVSRGEDGNSLGVEILYDSGVLSNMSVSGTISGDFNVDETTEINNDGSGDDSGSAGFQLSDVSDNGPVTEGETVNIDYNVSNDGSISRAQDVVLEVDGSEEDSVEESLDAGDSETGTLTWSTEDGDEGNDIEYNISTDNSSESDTLTVEGATVASPSVGGEWSHVTPAGAEGGYDYFFNESSGDNEYLGDTSVEYTEDGFFVMKYQASNDGSDVPQSVSDKEGWSEVSFDDSYGPSGIEDCQELDDETNDYDVHLMTNREWMTVARQVAQDSSNWADDNIGSTGDSGGLYQGNRDSASGLDRAVDIGEHPNAADAGGETERTHELASGDKVWDMSGDLWMWVDAEEDGTTIENSDDGSKIYETDPESSEVEGGDGLGSGGFSDGEGALRGGYWDYGNYAGMFSYGSSDPGNSFPEYGFRCSAVPIS